MNLRSLLGFSKKAPDRKPSDAPRSPFAGFFRNKKPTVAYQNVIAAEKALQHPIVFRALHKIASSVQQVRWYVDFDPDVIASERASATDIKKLNELLKAPNDTLAPDQLRYWLALTFACYGRAPFKVGVGVGNIPNGIYPLNAPFVSSIANNRGQIVKYEYGSSAEGRDTMPTRKQAERDNALSKGWVHEIYTPNLTGLNETGKNINVLGAIGLPADVIEMLLQRAYDTASGHPNSKYIISAEKTLTEPQKAQIKAQIEGREIDGEDSGNVLFLSNTTVKVDKLDNDLSDIHSKMPMDDMARMIYGAFGIPISLMGMGAADGAKFAGNYVESRQSFWEDTIIPNYCTPIATGMTAAICPPGARVFFDLDSIDAILDSRTSRLVNAEKASFLTNDEKRELAGFPPLTEDQRAKLKEEAALRKPPSADPAPVA